MLGAVQGESHFAGAVDGFQLVGVQILSPSCGSFDCDDHQGWPIEDGPQRGTNEIVGLLDDFFDTIHGAIADDCNSLGVVQRVCDQSLELGEAGGVVISDELMDKNDFIVDRG